MKAKFVSMLTAALVLLLPVLALAADDEAYIDARTEGYANSVKLPEATPALTWFAFILLTIICVVTMFKNAKRTHLD